MLVFGGFALNPRMIGVEEINPLPYWRMATSPKDKEGAWSWVAEILALQFHKSGGGGVVIMGDFEPKPIGFMLNSSRKVIRQWHCCQVVDAEEEKQEGQRGYITELTELELRAKFADEEER